MTMVNDNWEIPVAAALERDKFHEIALADSRETGLRSSFSSRFSSSLCISPGVSRLVPVHLAETVIKAAEAAALFKKECMELRHKTQQLESLIKQAVYRSDILYDLPTGRIMYITQSVLHQALVLVTQCREGSLKRRLFTKISVDAFRTMSSQLDHSIRNVTWLLCDEKYSLDLPPIATDEPVLYNTWQLIAILHTGSVQDRCNAAATLSRDNHLDHQLIIEEGGVRVLSKLLEEGTIEGKENAIRALGVLVRYPKSIDEMIRNKVWEQFCGILEEGPIKVQSAVVWVISEIADNEHLIFFLEGRTVELLVNHLESNGAAEKKDPVVKVYMYAMAARTLWRLVKLGNYSICRSIVYSSAVSHLAVLLDKGPKESSFIFTMALMEITELPHYAFIRSCLRFDSFARKAIVDLFFRVTYEMVDSELLLPSIKIIGNLSQSFGETDVRMIKPLVKLLYHKQKKNISMQACITLVKLVRYDKNLSVPYCKEIIKANGAKYLVRLVHFGDEHVEIYALILLCYIALYFPQSKELVDARVLSVLSWALKHHKPIMQNNDAK